MVRFIYSLHHLDHVGLSHFRNLSWLSVIDRVNYFKLCHVFRIRAGTAPSYLSDDFVLVSAKHAHGTRSSHSCNFSISKLVSCASSSSSFASIKEWNYLPAQI